MFTKAIMILGALQLATITSVMADPSAACSARMTALRGDRYGLQQITKTVYHTAARALDHYRSEIKTEPVILQYVAYYQIETGSVTGYRFIIGAKDRSTKTQVTYYSDVAKKLVYAKKTPAPEQTYWICE